MRVGIGDSTGIAVQVLAEELATSPRKKEVLLEAFGPTQELYKPRDFVKVNSVPFMHPAHLCSHSSIAAEKLTGKSFSCGNKDHKTHCKVTLHDASFSSLTFGTVRPLIVGK